MKRTWEKSIFYWISSSYLHNRGHANVGRHIISKFDKLKKGPKKAYLGLFWLPWSQGVALAAARGPDGPRGGVGAPKGAPVVCGVDRDQVGSKMAYLGLFWLLWVQGAALAAARGRDGPCGSAGPRGG